MRREEREKLQAMYRDLIEAAHEKGAPFVFGWKSHVSIFRRQVRVPRWLYRLINWLRKEDL